MSIQRAFGLYFPSGNIYTEQIQRDRVRVIPVICHGFPEKKNLLVCNSPDDHDDAIKDIVGVLDVAKRPVD